MSEERRVYVPAGPPRLRVVDGQIEAAPNPDGQHITLEVPGDSLLLTPEGAEELMRELDDAISLMEYEEPPVRRVRASSRSGGA